MFKNSSKCVVAAVAIASVVSAQSPLASLSSTCQSALQGVLGAPEAQCLNLGTIVSAVVAGGNIDVPTLANTWLTGLCAAGSCSQASLSAIVNNITAGCETDIQNAFQADITASQVLPLVTQYYPSVREIACLKDTQANALCVPQTLTNIQNVIGTIDTSLLNIDTLYGDGQKAVASNLSAIACTSCLKEAYTIVSETFPDPSVLAQANPAITNTCGASFIDGQNVSTVTQTAAGGEFAVNTKSSAVSFVPLKAGAALVAISSALMVFA